MTSLSTKRRIEHSDLPPIEYIDRTRLKILTTDLATKTKEIDLNFFSFERLSH